MSIIQRNPSKLDAEECFKLWVELGTLKKVVMELTRRGQINKITGKPYGIMTVSNRAHRWVLENSEEARSYYIEAGTIMNEEQFDRWMITKAMTSYHKSPNRFFRWIEMMDFEKYEYVYEKRFGTLERWRSNPKNEERPRY